MNAVVKQQEATVSIPAAPLTESAALMSMIERAARDPSIDLDRMERLYTMHERAEARRAKAAFDAALAEMQPKLPSVEQRGRITISEKGDRNRIIQSTPYALFNDLNEAVKPFLAEHGFGLRFATSSTSDGKIVVTCILSHRDGHREETTSPPLMYDTTGSKNNVQSIGSSISYGRRYSLVMALNLNSHAPEDADDDGKAGGGKPAKEPETITVQQAELIRERIVALGANVQRFMERAGVDKLEHLSVADYHDAMRVLDQREKAAATKHASPRDQVRKKLQDSVGGAAR